jgi:hypothetical protein
MVMTKKNTARVALTKPELERLLRLLPDDLVRMKLTDEEEDLLREINETRWKEIDERSIRLSVEERPLLADLRKVGWNVQSVWDLVNTSARYTDAIPILLRHLLLPYSDRTREGIARALAVPDPAVRKAWPTLVAEYRMASDGWGIKYPGETKEFELGAKDGLACALKVAVTDETMGELISLAKDRSQGGSRLLLLSALRKSRNPLAKQALEYLASDPDLAEEIAFWRRRRTKN